MARSQYLLFLLLVATFSAGGASCPKRTTSGPRLPPAFVGPPTLDEVIRQINVNSASIHQLQGQSATLRIPGLPTLRTEIALERPQRFRLRADHMLTGSEVDLGSNEDLFWIWVRQADPPAVYFAQNQQYYSSAARQILPVEPTWLISALGVVELDPMGQHSGPTSAGPGQLAVTSRIETPGGPLQRVLILHDTQGTVLEQHLYDAQQRRLASSYTSQHQQDPHSGVILPHHVKIELPMTGLQFSIDVDRYHVNQLGNSRWQLWQMPRPPGYPLTDLASPNLKLSGPLLPQQAIQPPTIASSPAAARFQPVSTEPRRRPWRGRRLPGFFRRP